MGAKNPEAIKPFVILVKKNFEPCKVLLFGSHARGTANKESDYDIILISPRFKNIEFSKRAALAYRLKKSVHAAMDIICLTPHEFDERRKRPTVIREAAKEGLYITASA